RSLEVIAQKVATVWGEGVIALAVYEGVKQSGGYLCLDELSAMEANWYDPISISYNGYEVVTSGAPTAGFSALHRVGEMGLYDLPSIGLNTSAYIHLFAEVSKHAYWTYLRYGGSIDTILPNTGMILSKDYWQWMAQNIRPDSASIFHPPFDFEYISDASNTTHFVVADAEGNMVSATLSLGDVFGSKFMPAGTGLWMNNGAKFANFEQDNTPRDANPGRERVVMDSPIMLFKNGRPLAGLGTPGGGLMPQVMAQVILNMADFRQPLPVALSQPSVAFDPSGIVYYESGLPEAVIENLTYMGHQLQEKPNLGKPNGIEVVYDKNGTLEGYISQSSN
ncbi:MAG: gamma-glutamyltransferase, partial [Bacteroidota bacterium]